MTRCVSIAFVLLTSFHAFAQEGAEPAVPAPAEPAQSASEPEATATGESDDMERWWRESYEEYLPDEPGAAPAETEPEALATEDGPAGDYDDSLFERSLQIAMWLAVLLAAFFVGIWIFQRVGRKTRLLPRNDLAKVIGRVHLDKSAVLHFVRTGGRVLVVGVTPNAIQCLAEFDDETFGPDDVRANGEEIGKPAASNRNEASEKARRFFDELRTQQGKLTEPDVPTREGRESPDEEIATLRGDIARLQRMLREASDESDR